MSNANAYSCLLEKSNDGVSVSFVLGMYSNDFRRLAVRLFRDGRSYLQVSRLLRISTSTLHRWVRLGVTSRIRQPRKRTLTNKCTAIVAEHLSKSPITTQAQIQSLLRQHGVRVGVRSVSRLLRTMRLSRKRTVRRMTSSTCPNAQVSETFEKEVAARGQGLVVCVDECHFSERVLPLYGYSPTGHPCVVNSRRPGWTSRSLILAVASDGSRHFRLFDGAINTARFFHFIVGLPYPPGTTIILDNVAFHKRQTPFVAKAYRPLFTPPYSPEHNSPVENAFGKIKGAFRASWPWACGVDECVIRSVEQLTASDIVASFRRWREACIAGTVV